MTSEKGQETPMDKYVRFKNNINLWYKEMDAAGLTKDEQKILEPHFLSSWGVPPSQEQLMRMLMDEKICGFSLKESNEARKIVGKKQMSKIPELKEKVLTRAKNKALGLYVWKNGIQPQLGYSFSVIHALAYSFIGFQTMYLATHWNPIYWDTACLIVNSGSLEGAIDINEDDITEDISKKEQSTDYAKVAKALGEIISRGIKISLIDINRSNYSFEPDIKNNQILFGLKALAGVGAPIIEDIIAHRPYISFTDFMNRCPLNKTAMISLIKAGSFDILERKWANELHIEPRILIMTYYISKVCEPKTKLNLQNFNGLIQKDLIPQSLEFQKQVYAFNKYLKTKKVKTYYYLDDISLRFLDKHYDIENLQVINGNMYIEQTKWDKIYQQEMDSARNWLKDNQQEILKEFNTLLFQEMWNKYAQGSISAWEMDSLGFYYHPHELIDVDMKKYGLADFFKLSSIPPIERTFKKNGKEIPIYQTYKIIGTVISKNDTKSSIVLLTTTGVVNVKFTKDYYAMYNRQISEVQADGTKHVMEKGWFTRGTKLMVTGFRRDDSFVAKSYSHTATHQLYQIINVDNKGNMEVKHDRYQTKGEQD